MRVYVGHDGISTQWCRRHIRISREASRIRTRALHDLEGVAVEVPRVQVVVHGANIVDDDLDDLAFLEDERIDMAVDCRVGAVFCADCLGAVEGGDELG